VDDPQVESFFTHLQEDRALGQEYRSALTAAIDTAVVAAIQEVAGRHGYRFSADAARAHLERKAAELDDEQLHAVVGGAVASRMSPSPGRGLGFLSNPWVLAGVVAAAIAVPLAISSDDEGS
jgi:hypothetical protein